MTWLFWARKKSLRIEANVDSTALILFSEHLQILYVVFVDDFLRKLLLGLKNLQNSSNFGSQENESDLVELWK